VCALVGDSARSEWVKLCRAWHTIYKYCHELADALRPQLVAGNGPHHDVFVAAIGSFAAAWSATCGELTRYAHDTIQHLYPMAKRLARLGLTPSIIDMQPVEFMNLLVRRDINYTVSGIRERIVNEPCVEITDEQRKQTKSVLVAQAEELGLTSSGTVLELCARINTEHVKLARAAAFRQNPANHKFEACFQTMVRRQTSNYQQHRLSELRAAEEAADTDTYTRSAASVSVTALASKRRRISSKSAAIVSVPPELGKYNGGADVVMRNDAVITCEEITREDAH
jgi:hypothetical protein